MIGFQAAVEVNADNRKPLLVDPAESLPQKIRKRGMKMKTEDAVDDHVITLRHGLKLSFAHFFVAVNQTRFRQLLPGFNRRWGADVVHHQNDRHLAFGSQTMAGNHKPVAAVVAASAQNQKGIIFRIFMQQRIRAALAGQLH